MQHSNWDKENIVVHCYILNSLPKHLLEQVNMVESRAEMLQTLDDLYAMSSSSAEQNVLSATGFAESFVNRKSKGGNKNIASYMLRVARSGPIYTMPDTRFDPCKRQCWRSRREALPQGIVATTSNLEMRPLYMSNRISKNPLNLLSIAAGVKKKAFVKKGVAANLTSDSAPRYDVFVNFRGKDIRPGFLGHLIVAFQKEPINAFVDDKLERGYKVWPSLVGAIKDSFISLIIFSKDYASSSWCLDELVEIVERGEKYGQIVVPVFYNVEPTDVRHQTGSYGKTLAEHEKKYNFPFFWWKKYNSTRVQNWRHALTESANLSGITSSKFRTDAELVKEIIKTVNLELKKLDKNPIHSKGLVGICNPMEHLESLLHQESKDVRIIGIWGMGGIGKTTIAQEVFNKLRSEYHRCRFLASVTEESRRPGIMSLKEKLFSKLLRDDDVEINTPNGLSEYVIRRLDSMKVLIVLDDVNDPNQLEVLVGDHDWFGTGSRIIVTTRDKQVLANKVDDIYQVGALSNSEALVLFNLHAFKQNHLEMEYSTLSKGAVNYAKGIPLVLKVLGRLLCGKDKEVWESQLHKLKNMPIKEVYDVMILSYNDLDHKEKKIFLDLACFLCGLKVYVIKDMLKDHESDNSVAVGLKRLEDKALITISENNVVSMHEKLQEMAWEIVRQESSEDPGGRSHLRDADVHEVLLNDKGTEAIRSIQVNLFAFKPLKLNPHIFAKMSKLHFLQIDGIVTSDYLNYLPEGLQSLPTELRYLNWMNYPLKSLPEKFSAEKLVLLYLSHSSVEKLWDEDQNLTNLKCVQLISCGDLKELPDFSKASNLEVLIIFSCVQLTSMHPSIFSLDKLETLDLSSCLSLIRLETDTHLSSLKYLNLEGCTSLKEFSLTAENMIELDLRFTGLSALQCSSFGPQSKLEILRLRGSCIESLPSSIKNLTRLRYVDVGKCRNLRTLPELPPSLENLDAGWCTSLMTVLFPSTAAEQFKENKKWVTFWNCLKLDENSLVAIALNAQINMMKLAYQHVENYDDYNEHHDSYQAIYAYTYPGSSVPEWFEYKTINDHIIIDLSPPHSLQLGFIFCFIIGKQFFRDRVKFKITIQDGEGEGKKDSVEMYLDTDDSMLLDHVCVRYDKGCSLYLNSLAKNQTRLKVKVTVSIATNDHEDRVLLKGLGVSLINTSAYHNFKQQMELRDSN
ncbi:putative disease resistance protein At4g11170 [Gastrolobium bilobum]|uniref:putative disease resistance protein At4g11170 n=1 Tax=Gastrolobium bilobum TaxID=150636 RepID=UPI002AB14261|nr:putative disease resistance protein At4g11170 [Gastrolobium bilobum]